MLKFTRPQDPLSPTVAFRIMQTTCPLCHKAVQFALNDTEYIQDEIRHYQEMNEWLCKENDRLRRVLDKVLKKPDAHFDKTT